MKSGQKCPDVKWSSFQMVATIAIAIAKARPFKNRPSKSPDFKYFWISNGQISDPYCILRPEPTRKFNKLKVWDFWSIFSTLIVCYVVTISLKIKFCLIWKGENKSLGNLKSTFTVVPYIQIINFNDFFFINPKSRNWFISFAAFFPVFCCIQILLNKTIFCVFSFYFIIWNITLFVMSECRKCYHIKIYLTFV